MDNSKFKEDFERLSSEGVTQPIVLSAYGKQSSGKAIIKTFSRSERIRRAIRVAIIGLVISTLCAFIPILHFFLLPLGLLVSLVCMVWIFKQRALVLIGIGVCPCCGTEFHILRQSAKWPLIDVCEGCGRELQVTL